MPLINDIAASLMIALLHFLPVAPASRQASIANRDVGPLPAQTNLRTPGAVVLKGAQDFSAGRRMIRRSLRLFAIAP
jgi:hypothetical protein